MNVAVIPARGGSKRIPRKNIKDFCGKPIIAYSIETALASKLFDKVIVSTDDQEISDIAKNFGAEVPFLRPKELSDDSTATVPVIVHSIKYMESLGFDLENVCCIYATAPFLSEDSIRQAYKILEKNVMFSFPVTTFPFPIQRALYLNEKNDVKMFQPEYLMTRSQDLVEAYHDAGQFYWGKSSAWIDNLPVFAPHSRSIVISRELVQDIDTEEDWRCAEIMYRLFNKI